MIHAPAGRRGWSRLSLAAFSAVALLVGLLGVSAPAHATPITPLIVNNPGPQFGTVGLSEALMMTASGGVPPYVWSALGLPPGMAINSTTGVISGTPTTIGSYSTTVKAADSSGQSGVVSFPWVIRCAGAGQKLLNPGFESGAVSWSSTPRVIGQWAPAEPPASGTWDAWLDGYGSTHTDTLSQAVALPLGCVSYVFSFALHIDTATPLAAAYDKLSVQVLNSSGTVLATLATYSNTNAAPGYTLRSFSLAAYAGMTVTLLFTGTEDNTYQTSFVVDDTAVTVS
jgi:hypothetical protein